MSFYYQWFFICNKLPSLTEKKFIGSATEQSLNIIFRFSTELCSTGNMFLSRQNLWTLTGKDASSGSRSQSSRMWPIRWSQSKSRYVVLYSSLIKYLTTLNQTDLASLLLIQKNHPKILVYVNKLGPKLCNKVRLSLHIVNYCWYKSLLTFEDSVLVNSGGYSSYRCQRGATSVGIRKI